MRDNKGKQENIFSRLLAILVTAALLFGALTLIVYRDRFNVDALRRWVAYRSMQTNDMGEAEPFTYAGGEQTSVALLDDGVLIASNAGGHYYSLTGESYAEEIAPLEHPVLNSTLKNGVIFDAGGKSLFLFQGRETAFKLGVEDAGDLLSARTNASGWLAITSQQSGYKGAVTVYNAKQEKIMQISLSSTFVVDAAIAPDCRSVAVVTMDQVQGNFESQVLIFPLNEKTPQATISLGNAVVLDLKYDSNTIWALSETALHTISLPEGAIATYPFDRYYLKGCSLQGNDFALILLGRYRSGSATQAIVLGADAQLLASQPLQGQVLSYAAAGNYYSLLVGDTLKIYTGEFSLYSSHATSLGAKYTALAPNGTALLASTRQAWLYIP